MSSGRLVNETRRGHYEFPMLERIQHGNKVRSEECFAIAKEGRNRAYNITSHSSKDSRRLHLRVKKPPCS